jgi:hypothetical protein
LVRAEVIPLEERVVKVEDHGGDGACPHHGCRGAHRSTLRAASLMCVLNWW